MLKNRSRLMGRAGAVVTMAAIAFSGVTNASATSVGSRPTGARGAVSGA